MHKILWDEGELAARCRKGGLAIGWALAEGDWLRHGDGMGMAANGNLQLLVSVAPIREHTTRTPRAPLNISSPC